jgi:hypothetical protein
MQKPPRPSLLKLWETASSLQAKIAGKAPDSDGGHAAASALSWLIPGSRVQAIYSVPMGVLEMFALQVGGWTVGAAGAWPSGEYAKQVQAQKLVNAPCRIKPSVALTPSPLLTETLSRTREFQNMELAC